MTCCIKNLAPAMRFKNWRRFSGPATTQRSRRLLPSTRAAMSSPGRPSPPPGSSIPPPTTPPLGRTRSAFAGNADHYDRWMQLFQTSASTEFGGNAAGHYRTVSDSCQRYGPGQTLNFPSFAGVDDRHRLGGVWSEHPAFFTTMAGATEKFALKSPSPDKGLMVKKPPMAPPRLGAKARDDRLEKWLLDLAENNARFGASPPLEGSDSADGEPQDARPEASSDTPQDTPPEP